MKKFLLTVVVSLCAVGVQADRPFLFCDPAKSTLCGVASIYEFEEASDFARTSEIGGVRLLEPDGANVANSSTKKTGSFSLDHAAVANSYVYVPRATGPSGQFSVSFWIYITTMPSATTKRVQVLSTRDALGNEGYPRVYIYNNAGVNNLKYETKQGLTDTVATVTSTTALSTSTWYHVVFGQLPYSVSAATPYNRRIWISVNGTRVNNDTHPFSDVPTLGDFIIGGWLNTSPTEYGAYKIDQLASWGGTLSPADVTRLYNAGAGCAFPFVAVGSGC